MIEPDRVTTDLVQSEKQASGSGGPVALAKIVDRISCLLGPTDEAATADRCRTAQHVAGSFPGGIEETDGTGRPVELGHQIADAGTAVGEVRGSEGKGHVRHQPPAQAVGIGFGNVQQAITNRHCPAERLVMQSAAVGRQHHQCRPCRANRLIINLSVSGKPGDVGKRHRLDPADPAFKFGGLGAQTVEAGRGQRQKILATADPAKLA